MPNGTASNVDRKMKQELTSLKKDDASLVGDDYEQLSDSDSETDSFLDELLYGSDYYDSDDDDDDDDDNTNRDVFATVPARPSAAAAAAASRPKSATDRLLGVVRDVPKVFCINPCNRTKSVKDKVDGGRRASTAEQRENFGVSSSRKVPRRTVLPTLPKPTCLYKTLLPSWI